MIKDNKNCLFNRIAQNTRNTIFPKMRRGTPKLKTESRGKDPGGMCGSRYDSKSAKARKELIIKRILSINLKFFI